MIGKIKGNLADVNGNCGIIETPSGISFEVYLTPHIISGFPIGSVIELLTYLQVRDDAFVLYGFEDKNQHMLFKLLLQVSGVGPKTAYLIVSHANSDELHTAVKNNDVSYFSSIPGLGKKTAMKIILELSTKLKTAFAFDKVMLSEQDQLFIDTLVALGYKSQEARAFISKVPKEMTLEEKIQYALRLTTKKNKEKL